MTAFVILVVGEILGWALWDLIESRAKWRRLALLREAQLNALKRGEVIRRRFWTHSSFN